MASKLDDRAIRMHQLIPIFSGSRVRTPLSIIGRKEDDVKTVDKNPGLNPNHPHNDRGGQNPNWSGEFAGGLKIITTAERRNNECCAEPPQEFIIMT